MGFTIDPTGWSIWKMAETQATAWKVESTVITALRTVREVKQ